MPHFSSLGAGTVAAAVLMAAAAAGGASARGGAAGGASARGAAAAAPRRGGTEPLGYRVLRRDVIINADLWARKPEMMAAGLGFTGIIGVPNLSTGNLALSKTLTVLAGGTWNTVHCGPGQTPSLGSYTSAATPAQIRWTYGQDVYYSDGLPVEFSWPILPSTLEPGDFRVRLSNGTTVTPQVASIWPNFQYNQRSVAVLFGHFGNRVPPSRPGAIYPTSVRVVAGASTLKLVGPRQRVVSAVGLGVKTNGSPYTAGGSPADRGGPRLVAAKLTTMSMSAAGSGGPRIFRQNLPNSGVSLYGRQARFRLRLYTSGGMTPNGVSPLLPTDYDRYFQVDAVTSSGRAVRLMKAGRTYLIDGHPLRIVGLANLGRRQARYDACYGEVRNNYIDIILDGSPAAARRITTVRIPSAGRYRPLYNPGGPGTKPAPGVRYSAPSPPITQHVIIALKNPMTVTYDPRRGGTRPAARHREGPPPPGRVPDRAQP
ncbi:MAG TPA: hypothetical protein VLX31_14485 [Streptosporangiaceae bacterium]|nr:hypothetical protein [Streptosporangiaceae bacterium]